MVFDVLGLDKRVSWLLDGFLEPSAAVEKQALLRGRKLHAEARRRSFAASQRKREVSTLSFCEKAYSKLFVLLKARLAH
jgi:hypothetical protein